MAVIDEEFINLATTVTRSPWAWVWMQSFQFFFDDRILAYARPAQSGVIGFHVVFVPAEDRKLDKVLFYPTIVAVFHFLYPRPPPEGNWT